MRSCFLADGPISLDKLQDTFKEWLEGLNRPLNKVLLIPPDGTRGHSLAGPITNMLYKLLQPAEVRVLPAWAPTSP